MNYLAYYEIPESNTWNISNNIESLKGEWCFAMRIFEVPDDLTMEKFKEIEKPRFQVARNTYKQIYSYGSLMHETDNPVCTVVIRATVPKEFDINKHHVTKFKRENYESYYELNKDGYFQYKGISAESSLHYTEEALLGMSDVEVVSYALK